MNLTIGASPHNARKRENSSSVSAVTGGAAPIDPFPTDECGCQVLGSDHCRQSSFVRLCINLCGPAPGDRA